MQIFYDSIDRALMVDDGPTSPISIQKCDLTRVACLPTSKRTSWPQMKSSVAAFYVARLNDLYNRGLLIQDNSKAAESHEKSVAPSSSELALPKRKWVTGNNNWIMVFRGYCRPVYGTVTEY